MATSKRQAKNTHPRRSMLINTANPFSVCLMLVFELSGKDEYITEGEQNLHFFGKNRADLDCDKNYTKVYKNTERNRPSYAKGM